MSSVQGGGEGGKGRGRLTVRVGARRRFHEMNTLEKALGVIFS